METHSSHFADSLQRKMARRQFLNRTSFGIGTAAFSELLRSETALANDNRKVHPQPGILEKTHLPATAKRVIYLFMHGGPSQIETFDYKPELLDRNGIELIT